MYSILDKLDGEMILGLCGMLVGVVAILGGIAVAVTKVMADHNRKTRANEIEATLKMEMINRGMSAGDIKQVLEARMGSTRPKSLGDVLSGIPPLPNLFGKKAKDC